MDLVYFNTAVSCPPIGSPVNGSLIISVTGVYQDTALYVFEDGFNLVGMSERVCQSDGTWSGSASAKVCKLLYALYRYGNLTPFCITSCLSCMSTCINHSGSTGVRR